VRPVPSPARVALLAAAALGASSGAAAAADGVRSGSLHATAGAGAWRLTIAEGRRVVLRPGRLSLTDATGRHRATRILSTSRAAGGLRLVLATDAPGRTLAVRLAPAEPGVLRLTAEPRGGRPEVSALGIAFHAPPAERFAGFGERADAVEQRGNVVRDEVSDGPFRPGDCALAGAVIPPWGFRCAPDASRYPIPWLLSTAGYGVLVDDDEPSTFDLHAHGGRAWTVTVEAARLDLRIFAGPTPARALARFTAATGRQPPPPAPWAFGPWFQTGQPNTVPLRDEARWLGILQRHRAPVSVAETQLRYLPCGLQRGHEAYERRRVRMFHRRGLAILTYLNPEVCRSYAAVYGPAAAAGALQTASGGGPFTFPAFVGGVGPAGFSIEPVAQFDFTSPAGRDHYARRVRQVVRAGHDGWMEDFGEYTSPEAHSADGTPGRAMHNRYPESYHCATWRMVLARPPRALLRFQRSGWTGAARCAQDVWGGDPTTVWGDDGLRGSVRQALSMGLSGVSRWGSDIGGYDSFGAGEHLTPELLERWIEFGAVSGVMRTKSSGLALPAYRRPQIWDPGVLPVWRRYARLHTQLYPYIRGADARYRATGLPLMSALLLRWPRDPRAVAADDEFLFGPALLAAPVLRPGARRRALYLPPGRWVDVWRSVRYDPRGGGFHVTGARVRSGGRRVTVRARRAELPLLARAGALLPLLPPAVSTLAPYGRGRGIVHLGDRRRRLRLLAFPAGRSAARAGARDRLRSRATRSRWRLAVRSARPRVYDVEAATGLLRFRPASVRVDGRRVPMRLRDGVLTFRARAARGRTVIAVSPRPRSG
jgi:alpha-glucosidase